MNIRPYTDALRRAYGETSFIKVFDSAAGGGRVVRLAALFGGIDGEVDCRRDLAVQGDRWVEVDISDCAGAQRAAHGIVTRDCPVDKHGPLWTRSSTFPTPFRTPQGMLDAIRHETARTDHPQPERNRDLPTVADARVKTAVGPTILLQSGHYFDLLDPHGSEFTIEDIAHGLSMVCRFAGQCRQFYSVAEHSWHTSFMVDERFKLAALMHDAAEAFIGDVTRPLKSLLPDYKAIERNIEAAIAERFGIPDVGPDEIKRADLAMLHAEQAAMMPHHADRWSTSPEAEADARIVNFRCWCPDDARRAFLWRFDDLGGQR